MNEQPPLESILTGVLVLLEGLLSHPLSILLHKFLILEFLRLNIAQTHLLVLLIL